VSGLRRADVTAGYIQFGIEDLREPMQMIEAFVLSNIGNTYKAQGKLD
jgi:hypothetical protein